MCFILGTILYSLLILTVAFNNSFNRSHVAVFFEPCVSVLDIGNPSPYGISGLIPLISKISSKFSKIMMTKFVHGAAKTETSVELIPSAVATYNKNKKDTAQEELEVMMRFSLTLLRNGSIDYENSNFVHVKELADEANAIYHGSVKTLYLSYQYLSMKAVTKTKEYLLYANNLLGKYSKYDLGASLPLADCGILSSKPQVADYIVQILPYMRQIIFYDRAEGDIVLKGAEIAAQFITQSFERCVENIRMENERISVGFHTGWEYTDKVDEVQNTRNLVQYWGIMNDWAVRLNKTVVLYEAFDSPCRIQHRRRHGWWKLIENSSYINSWQYVFEEKSQRLPEFKDDIPQSNQSENIYLSTTSIVALVASVLAILALIGDVILYKLLRKKLYKSSLGNEDITKVFIEGAFSNDLSDTESDLPAMWNKAYDTNLELLKNWFKIDWKKSLGKGAFATVYRGTIQKGKSAPFIEVAVKTAKTSCTDEGIKGLFSEIKVLSHLGKHENIVELLGAYTKELKKGKAYIFLELCSLGSLHSYLHLIEETIGSQGVGNIQTIARERTPDLLESEANVQYLYDVCVDKLNGRDCANLQTETCSHTTNFYRWSCEIANGMEFIASKKVVHADLATRNVLLTHDKRAKISDFGLSRRLYDYSNYVKNRREQLPWRWMAPESLRKMKFKEKSDVWSFGVTLWEIHSLGDLPYQGMEWNPNFSSKLTKGLRLQEPTYNNKGMYSVMLRCWNLDPNNRPTFSELRTMLRQVFSNN